MPVTLAQAEDARRNIRDAAIRSPLARCSRTCSPTRTLPDGSLVVSLADAGRAIRLVAGRIGGLSRALPSAQSLRGVRGRPKW